jgi:hypothetical protein
MLKKGSELVSGWSDLSARDTPLEQSCHKIESPKVLYS